MKKQKKILINLNEKTMEIAEVFSFARTYVDKLLEENGNLEVQGHPDKTLKDYANLLDAFVKNMLLSLVTFKYNLNDLDTEEAYFIIESIYEKMDNDMKERS